tara:strand:+ start:712 stop:1050 length:339 start_codon:yes stop_codon:yes gene_type:complete
MSVIVYIENENGHVKKSSLEAAFYASRVANQIGKQAIGVAIGEFEESSLVELGQYGLSKVVRSNGSLNDFDPTAYSNIINSVFDQEGGELLVLAFGFSGKAIASRLSVRLKA